MEITYYMDLSDNKVTIEGLDHLGGGSCSQAYLAENGRDVYLITDRDDYGKDILKTLQGLPHIPKMQYLGSFEDKNIWLTEFSAEMDNNHPIFQTFSKNRWVGCDSRPNKTLEDISSCEELPQSLRDSIAKIFFEALAFTSYITYDIRRPNLAVSASGEVILRDIVYFG